ncbi:hypothetical protein C8E03_108197 [Lachnotalea glycerini]|uniref:Uncharacterized protein n=1 Tax=Lachnotalea glycerini TaxID=1763509 RepID=A0A318EQU3_9FIRM|nr:hypothetical protein [Lachnotalea glycerini]PXV88470.1 hypothetical protein C8E03_108197 [Lachnotalea glycerini]
MHRASKDYKEQMKQEYRNRTYQIVSLGLINQDAQRSAYIKDKSPYTNYSDFSKLFNNVNDSFQYATLENNFTKVNGQQYFIPRTASQRYKNGLITSAMPVSSNVVIRIDFNTIDPLEIKGATIDFGENYPIDFKINGETGDTCIITNNDTGSFETDFIFEDTKYLIITVSKMRFTYNRVRIYSIQFGIGLAFNNNHIMSSKLNNYGSAISDSIYQSDFSVTINNRDMEFNVDNPASLINFLEENQDMTIYFGYELEDGTVEWIKTATLKVSAWESDDQTATIKAQDLLRELDDNYYKGQYYTNGITLYALAVLVLNDGAVEEKNRYIDPYLKKVTVRNPLPNVTHKEALQIIANAGRCVLSVNRDGQIQLKSSFIPDSSIISNGETSYSNVANTLNETVKQEYAEYTQNFTKVGSQQYFIPRNLQSSINTGYISSFVSDENGEFESNPVITRSLEASFKTYGIQLTFGGSLPSGFIVRTYLYDNIVESITITKDIDTSYILNYDFQEFDKISIEFVGTQEPFNRIHLNNFHFGDLTDYHITYNDMLSTPKANKLEKVKTLYISQNIYGKSSTLEQFVNEDVDVYLDDLERTFYFTSPVYNISIRLVDATSGGVSIIETGAYYVKCRFSGLTQTTKLRLVVEGYKYNITTLKLSKQLNNRGITKEWSNPLIDSQGHAADVLEWLGEYFTSDREYEISYRGEPAINITDIIYQENKYEDNMRVVVEESTLSNNGGALSGSLVTRKRVE